MVAPMWWLLPAALCATPEFDHLAIRSDGRRPGQVTIEALGRDGALVTHFSCPAAVQGLWVLRDNGFAPLATPPAFRGGRAVIEGALAVGAVEVSTAAGNATWQPCAVPHHFSAQPPRGYQVGRLPMDLIVRAEDETGAAVDFCGPAEVVGLMHSRRGRAEALRTTPLFVAGSARLERVWAPGDSIVVRTQGVETTIELSHRRLPGILSLLPPLFAILLAVVIRQALLALFAGVWMAATFVHDYNPLTGLLRAVDTYLLDALADPGHAAIVLFTMALGGMVGVIGRSGGTRALVDAIASRARSRRAGMLTAWAAGLVIFFDDYANCLLVGNTVRPFTDRLRVSREKLAYIVDSTAAPVATIALISTWVGYQVGLLDDALAEFVGPGQGYDLFLRMLPYSFYSFFTVLFVFAVSATVRDFGPMYRAEIRATTRGEVVRPDAIPLMDRELTELAARNSGARRHWLSALVPIAAVLVLVAAGLYISGTGQLGEARDDPGLRAIIAAADPYRVLLWASFGGSLVALLWVVLRGELGVGEAIEAWIGGAKAMVLAVLILVLAWTLGTMCQEHLQTGAWVVSQIDPSARLLPLITFLVSALIAVATGSSYSTMAIVIPIAGPMAWLLGHEGSGLEPEVIAAIRYATVAAVLGGAVFGDHCSPISDTTIMSSMSSASDHVDHVRTQTPYALLCAAVAAVVGYLPAGWGVSPLVTVPIGAALLVAVLYLVGRRVPDPGSPP